MTTHVSVTTVRARAVGGTPKPPRHTRDLLHRRARRCTAMLLLPFLGAACQSWHTHPLPVVGGRDRAVPGHVRATRADGSRIELTGSSLVRDTLRGEAWRSRESGQPLALTVPLDSLRKLESRGVSGGRTFALVGGGVVAALTVIGIVVFQDPLD